VAWYDESDEEWRQTFKSAPLPSFNTLQEIVPDEFYWLFVTDSAVLQMVN
jgi:hypothetical protein